MNSGTPLGAAFCLAACLGVQAAASQSPDKALQVSLTALPDSTGRVNAEVKNVSRKPITAYALKWTGGEQSHVVTYEFFPSLGLERFVSNQDGAGALQPGLTRKAGSQFSKFVPGTQASATPVAVVFEGGSAVGDDNAIDRIFTARQAETADLNRWLEAASKLDPSNGVQFFSTLSALSAPAIPELHSMIDELRQRFSKDPDPELPHSYLKYLRARCEAGNLNSRRAQ